MENQGVFQGVETCLRELKKAFELSVAEEIRETGEYFERHLVFQLAKESFALPVIQLREVLGNRLIVSVPGAPPSVHGVINYKNKILPVTNIHHLLQIPFHETDNACLLVSGAAGFETTLLIDRLVNLISIGQETIKPKAAVRNETRNQLITGEIYYRDKLITLLDITAIN